MKDPVLPLFARVVADHSPNTRQELAKVNRQLLMTRILRRSQQGHRFEFEPVDVELINALILLFGDDTTEVIDAAEKVISCYFGLFHR